MKFPPLAMPFDDDGETAGQSTSDARDSDMSVLALAALNKLSSGVAVIGPRNRILFRNPRFVEFFDEDEWAEKIRPLIAGVADGAGVREVALPDGRTFNVEISPLPQGRLIVVEDISRRVAQCARDALQAQIDPVTLLGNAPMFRERLTAMLANMGPARQTACVLVVELVGFNAVTPSLGDPLLCIVAGRLVSALGGGGCAARLGGERFAILQAGQPQPQSAAVLAKRIIDLIGRSYLVDGHLLNIGACVGIALIPNDGETYEEILKNASLALDRAQQQGRVAYRFFETAMERQSRERRSLELDLRSALALREFGLAYQPQLNIAQGADYRIRSAAALAQPKKRAGVSGRVHSAG
jgi:diguanylate cyclase (GGDEF)-like protein